jgi:hypothetical protein
MLCVTLPRTNNILCVADAHFSLLWIFRWNVVYRLQVSAFIIVNIKADMLYIFCIYYIFILYIIYYTFAG